MFLIKSNEKIVNVVTPEEVKNYSEKEYEIIPVNDSIGRGLLENIEKGNPEK